MIGRLCGALVAEELDGRVILDVSGVGYEVLMPLGASGRARALGEPVVLHIHTHVREDSLELFGFPTSVERDVFRLLITVPNVGPKTALAVLSELPPRELGQAVAQGDVKRLSQVTGIGKKTAERLALELKGKLPKLSAEVDVAPSAAGAPGNRERLIGALTHMGYRAAEAERAVEAMGGAVAELPLSAALKEALALLAK
ncbi:MAG: Holliday junction branch migration protein RuvA [Polyangiaceae bacterium]|nr:Holliday junction branch migration protein RuvA [Polyangiaceae bacterium]MCW5789071.1 Holliday junction branch migration protein RuvA [Polyangiaceae bacterium]